MGNSRKSSKTKKRRKHIEEEDSCFKKTSCSNSGSSSELSTSESDSESPERKRHRRHHHRRSKRWNSKRDRKKREKSDRDRKSKRRRRSRSEKRSRRRNKYSGSDSDSDSDSEDEDESEESASSTSSSSGEDENERSPRQVLLQILQSFPNVANDLKQLLQMIDDGQAVDIRGLSEKSLTNHLKKLFLSLNFKRNCDGVFLRPSNVRPALEVVGHLISSPTHGLEERQIGNAVSEKETAQCQQMNNVGNVEQSTSPINSSAPRKRVIGPEMPSAELLAAAAKLTEAEAELRNAELEDDTELFIGPPPPAVVSEAESANDAERFEEVTRIMGVEADSPYDVLGVNHNMSVDNVKKRYWKLSLMVHPDKCSHPQAHQAFIILNKAFKDLQNPDKRKALDDKIKLKEEQESFKAELKAMREAAQWRRLQGISMEGDAELLADTNVRVAPTRDEWMTKLPSERKPGVTMQTTKFSKSSKEGRGDTSCWTDTPLDRAEKAKMNYLEAYNEASALASNEEEKKRTNSDAELVDKYNKAKRSKSLVQKHQEETVGRSKKKSKQKAEKEEWVDQHPWKPWDREKDLTAGRQSVKLDSENMAQGLTSRFSSGNFQRNFL